MWIYIFDAIFTVPFIGQNSKSAFNTCKLQGHETSTVSGHVTIPLDIRHFLLELFRTKPLSPAFLEILGHKDNWVTTLTFLGHVTSSVMWPFDSQYPISYSSSIVTKPLSLTVFEILASKVPALCKSLLRMCDITWPVPLCKIWVHIWICRPHIAYSLWHFYLAPIKNKGCLLVRPPMLNAKSSENSPDQNWANFGGLGGLGVRGFK